MPGAQPLHQLVDAIESAEPLDDPGKALGAWLRGLLGPGRRREAVSGTWLGHAAHPPLTDVVIGTFLSASMLDLLGSGDGRAPERLLGLGLVAALPTAVSGAGDWADTEIADPRVRRVGLAHAGANVTALTLNLASLAARRRGARGRGVALTLAANTVLTVGGFLGGHMSYTRGVGPNQTAYDPGPQDWTAVASADELVDGAPLARVAAETPVFMVRHSDDGIHAIHDRCSHRGCLLSDGRLDDHVVTCACHGSQFDIRDGTLLRGPATVGQPALQAREVDGRVEVRLAQ